MLNGVGGLARSSTVLNDVETFCAITTGGCIRDVKAQTTCAYHVEALLRFLTTTHDHLAHRYPMHNAVMSEYWKISRSHDDARMECENRRTIRQLDEKPPPRQAAVC